MYFNFFRVMLNIFNKINIIIYKFGKSIFFLSNVPEDFVAYILYDKIVAFVIYYLVKIVLELNIEYMSNEN